MTLSRLCYVRLCRSSGARRMPIQNPNRSSYVLWVLALISMAAQAAVPPVSFNAPKVYPANGARAIAAADFNGDGKMDIAAGDNTGVSILLGNGDGTFQPPVSYALGSYAAFVIVGDFNGDGKPDLAAANMEANQISVLLGKGDGTFQIAVTYAVGYSPAAIAVADFNGDGKLDLAVNSIGLGGPSSTISILLGNGDGTFQPARNNVLGAQSFFVVAGDFNGDGKQDLAWPNYGSNAVSIQLGNGDGTFKPPVNYSAGTGPETLAIGDFNGDGKPDIVWRNYSTGQNAVWLMNGTSLSSVVDLPALPNLNYQFAGPR